jgi:hypothetical protein
VTDATAACPGTAEALGLGFVIRLCCFRDLVAFVSCIHSLLSLVLEPQSKERKRRFINISTYTHSFTDSLISRAMLSNFIFVTALLVGSVVATPESWNLKVKKTINDVHKRNPQSFIPGQTNGFGKTCAAAFGAGFLQCGASECFNPTQGQSCCSEGCKYFNLISSVKGLDQITYK